MYSIVQVVEHNSRLRVKPFGKNGWVRFPKDLRLDDGTLYEVSDLRKSTTSKGNKFWIACGDIRPLRQGKRLKFRVKRTRQIKRKL